jgi:putative tricarboxylic transport membrane protein
MRFSDSAIGTFLILVSAGALLHMRKFPALEPGHPGPAAYPSVLAVLMILAGVGLVIRGVRRGERFFKVDGGAVGGLGRANIPLVLLAPVAYIVLAEPLGFLITSSLLLAVMMKGLRVGTLWSLLMAFFVTAGIYLLFGKMLRVPLPWGLWGW